MNPEALQPVIHPLQHPISQIPPTPHTRISLQDAANYQTSLALKLQRNLGLETF
jgi:hypothetical protein